MSHRISAGLLAAALMMVIVAGIVGISTGSETAAVAKFDQDGNLLKPEGYRMWVYVGAPVTPNDMNEGHAAFPEFHSVYIDPQGFDAYRKTGKFPDGTVMIKELVSVGTKEAPSGNGYFMGDFIGLAASVKDSKRFAKEPGHWAYFNFTDPGKPDKMKAGAEATAACNACHEKNAADDWVFTQYYPVLRAVKAKSK
ncbi:MAG: cytochrome P460 family protein [bacterium]